MPRSQLEQHPRFTELSPEVGEVDLDELDRAVAGDPDDTLPLLMLMARATDVSLRRRVRALAPRLVLERARTGMRGGAGVARLRAVPAHHAGDLDVDASLDAVLDARAVRRVPHLADLRGLAWERPRASVCLLLDRSGSMEGQQLATAALAAAACALHAAHAGSELAVVAFDSRAEVLQPMGSAPVPDRVVDRVIGLRGHGVTSLDAALRAAATQHRRATAPRRVTLLLSDCRVTDDVDPTTAARGIDDLRIVAPADDDEQARAFARAVGARVATLATLRDLPRTLEALLD
ncbi:vWA domain-containing protein [Nocardioides zeae]